MAWGRVSAATELVTELATELAQVKAVANEMAKVIQYTL